MRFSYLRKRLPRLPKLDGLPQPVQDYLTQLATALSDWERADLQAIAELDNPPILRVGLLTANQALTANTQTTVQFNATTVDTHGWWDGANYQYAPQEPGFYRCAWAVRMTDSAALAASTFAVSKVFAGTTEYSALEYGNGTATNIHVGGAAIVECNGATDAITVTGHLSAGTAPAIVAGTAPAFPTWLAIDYLGRRAIQG